MLSAAEAVAVSADLIKGGSAEWARLRRFVRYARGKQALPWLPDDAETEYRDIARKSASNWLDLIIRSTTEGLIVDGFGDENEPVWDRGWQANAMDSRQDALHRAVETLGYSYLIVLPSDDGGVWMRPEAATSMVVHYDDPWDEWPKYGVRQITKDRREFYDNEARYVIDGDGSGATVTATEHGLGLCPIVKMLAQLDLLGMPMGEVEPVISIQDRIVDATFSLQMVAKYGAFPQRWIAGITVPTDENGDPLPPRIKAYIDHILMAGDADTKFGQFAAADLGPYVEALDAHIRHLAAITQTPPHYLLGSLVNLSAEALAAAEAGLQRKIQSRRQVLGEGYEQALRLAAAILGDESAAMDTSRQVRWRDVESRSLSQAADAVAKLAQIGFPLQVLAKMIPGWTQRDIDDLLAIIESGDAIGQLTQMLERQSQMPELNAVTG